MARDPTVQQSVMAVYETLPPGERKLADTVLARLGDLASYSATELAAHASVSKATAARFFRRIGYESFGHARRKARAEAQLASPLYALAGVAARARRTDALSAHLAADVKNLSESFRQSGAAVLEQAAAQLAKAQRVQVLGMRNGHFVAGYAAYLLGQVRDGVSCLPGGAITLAEDLVSLRPGDVLLVLDFSRRAALLPATVAAARRAGARPVFIASPGLPPLARGDETVIHCRTDSASIFHSYVAAVSLVNYLCAAVAKSAGRKSRQRLEAIEDLHEALGDIRH